MARDKDVEVIEALSEMNSLTGVPGWLIDATLGCLDRILTTLAGIAAVAGADDALSAGGVSVLGVLVMRMICGPVFFRGDPVVVLVGVPGRDVDSAVIDMVRGFLAAASAAEETRLSDAIGSFLGICKGPGCWRFTLDIDDFVSGLTAGEAWLTFRGEGGTLPALDSATT